MSTQYRVFFMLWDVPDHIWATEWLTLREAMDFSVSKTVNALYIDDSEGNVLDL